MKRQKRFKKMKLPPFLEDAVEAVLKKSVSLAVVITFSIVVVLLVRAFLYGSGYFRLRAIETRDAFVDQAVILSSNAELLRIYGRKSIFSVNLKDVERSLMKFYPDAKEVLVRMSLPDKLIVSLKFRKPIAVVANARQYPVDEDGMVLPKTLSASLSQLPVIYGANISPGAGTNKASVSRNLKLAIDLLKEIKRSRFLTGYGVASVDAKDSRNLSFCLKNGTEIKIGSEDFRDRLEILERTLKDPRIVIGRIKYIDVRFKDAVIGPK